MNVLLIIVDWFGGAIVTLPLVLGFLYFTDKKRFQQKWIWAALFTLYLSAMFIIIGMPDSQYATWHPELNLVPLRDFSLRNILGMGLNIVLFVPFGGFLPIYFQRFRNVKRTVLAGFLMSLWIELLQLFTFRATDVDDLIMNTLGALAGYGIAKIILAKKHSADTEDRDEVKLLAMVLLTAAVTVFIRYPLVAALLQWLNL